MGISGAQIVMFAVLGAAMALFMWGRWRYDLVALCALLTVTLAGIVPAPDAFLGFGHPAVVTVAAVLVISRALQNCGIIDRLSAGLGRFIDQPLVHVAALTGLAALLSGFMNNVGALALLMPVALHSAAATGRSPARLLMPLSFGSILGGLMTLMGTPPNIIVASYRRELTGEAFSVFDFSPVGVALAAAGVAFIALAGWRLIPGERRGQRSTEDLFQIKDYIFEARVAEGSPVIGKGLRHMEVLSGDEVKGVGVLREDNHIIAGARYARLRAGDVIILEADAGALAEATRAAGLELLGDTTPSAEDLSSEDAGIMEAVVMPASRLVGRTFAGLRLAAHHNINLIAVAREGKPFKSRLERVRLKGGDVMLLQGDRENLPDIVVEIGCLPLPERGLQLSKRPHAALPVGIFAAALGSAAIGLVPVHVAFAAAVALLAVLGVVSVREVYDAIDWPVIILLGSMIPLGRALEATGATALIASGIASGAGDLGPVAILALLLIVTMTLSDVMNNAATAVVMAPIAADLAARLGVNPDPFLMAVAVGASCAFLTPIGHQNNVLVMGPGGYRFGDYWRMGLPLEALIVAIGVPMIALVWPL